MQEGLVRVVSQVRNGSDSVATVSVERVEQGTAQQNAALVEEMAAALPAPTAAPAGQEAWQNY